eukprot:3152940-Prymnesium_polylepis.3
MGRHSAKALAGLLKQPKPGDLQQWLRASAGTAALVCPDEQRVAELRRVAAAVRRESFGR